MNSSAISVQSVEQAKTEAVTAAQYLPEPATQGLGVFQDIASTVAQVGAKVVSGVDLGSVDHLSSAVDLINKQIQVSQEMQAISLASNIEKSKHEGYMAVTRNVRVGG